MGKTYVMADIHGCYDEYIKALELINFKDEDVLFVLGDIVDRGEEPIKVLQDMMCRPNVYPIVGNHDLMAAHVLKKLHVEITAENAETQIDEELMHILMDWQSEGGNTTLEKFTKLSREEQEDILEYFEEFEFYEELQVAGKKYLLVHAGLENYDSERTIDDYEIHELIYSRPNYDIKYFDDVYTVSGHTPTIKIDEGNQGTIVRKNNHIAIDCGCIYGCNLAVLCLDTDEEFYVPKI